MSWEVGQELLVEDGIDYGFGVITRVTDKSVWCTVKYLIRGQNWGQGRWAPLTLADDVRFRIEGDRLLPHGHKLRVATDSNGWDRFVTRERRRGYIYSTISRLTKLAEFLGEKLRKIEKEADEDMALKALAESVLSGMDDDSGPRSISVFLRRMLSEIDAGLSQLDIMEIRKRKAEGASE